MTIRVDNQKVEIQEVENVSKGNKLLSAHLATNGSITISKDLNDDDGHVITALEKSKKPGWWKEIDYEVVHNESLGGVKPL